MESSWKSNLTCGQLTMLQSFQTISEIEDEFLCFQILEQNTWNLDSALNQYIQKEPSQNSRSDRGTLLFTNHDPSVSTLDNRRSRNVENTNNGVMQNYLFPLRWLFQTRPISLNPDQDTIKFVDDFNFRYTPNHPTFFQNSYQKAVINAFQNSKFLLVYLHSPIHDDTNRFCRNVLSSQNLINLTNQHMVVWANSIWNPEAYALSTQLRASSFPFLALLICESNRYIRIADRIQGIVLLFNFFS
jgi:hypothetical protein